jgi:hypothetical protein
MQDFTHAPITRKACRILALSALVVGISAAAQTASATAYVDYISKNQGASSNLSSDNFGTWTNKVITAGGTGTGSHSWTGTSVYSTVTTSDKDAVTTYSNAYCTFYTQSVYSTYYMHYQYYALTTPHNATDGTGRLATCTQAFTFENQLGDGSYDTTMTVNFH